MRRVLLPLLLFMALSAASAQKENWISPYSVRNGYWSLYSPLSKWDTLKTLIQTISIHVNALETPDTALITQAVGTIRAAGCRVNFEVGGLRPFSGCDSLAGERHAQTELSLLQKWISRGGRIDYLSMDSPVNTMIASGQQGNCGWSVARAAGEIVDYMKAVRRRIPGVTFALIEPVPWYSVGIYPHHPGNHYGDLPSVLDTVMGIVRSRGEEIAIFHADSPYEYSDNAQTQGWNKLAALQSYVRGKGMRFAMIYNSQEGGFSGDQLYFTRTLDGWRKFKAAGGDPDILGVWSWYDHPARDYPESEPWTFSYTAKEFFLQAAGGFVPRTPARFEPPDGFVYHGVQTAYGGADTYIAALNDCAVTPYVRGLFIAIPGPRDPGLAFRGLREHLKNAESLGFFPEFNISLCASSGSPNGARDSAIAETSQYDALLDTVAIICRQYGKRVFVRIGGEFNGVWNGGGYKPHYYPKAFRKIVDMFAARGARDSAAFVWCYEPDAPDDFDRSDAQGPWYYPGDEYVDWFGLDVFDAEHFKQTLPDSVRGSLSKKGKSERFLRMAREHGKPVFLDETSAKGVVITADPTDGQNDWRAWFAPFWDFLSVHPEIKGFMYTNQDWENTGYPGWGDARIQNNSFIVQKYREEMQKPKYIHLPCSVSGIREKSDPSGAVLSQNYPNPFSRETMVTFRLGYADNRADFATGIAGSGAAMKVYDVLGRETLDLTTALRLGEPGLFHVSIRASLLPAPGLYIARLAVGGSVYARTIVYAR